MGERCGVDIFPAEIGISFRDSEKFRMPEPTRSQKGEHDYDKNAIVRYAASFPFCYDGEFC